MRALWHLATSGLAGRRGRTVLLVVAVALATTLIVAVAAAVGTLERSVRHVVGRAVGFADVSARHRFGGRLAESVLEEVRSWPEVALAAGRVEGGAVLRLARTDRKATVLLRGVEPRPESALAPSEFVAGRAAEADDEVVLCPRLQRELDARVGDVVDLAGPGGGGALTVVGIVDRPGPGAIQQPMAVGRLSRVQAALGQEGGLGEVRLRLRDGADVRAFVEARQAGLPAGAALFESASVQAAVEGRLRLADLMLHVLTLVTALSAALLIVTSLTTAATQQVREMAILRCLGTSRGQLAGAQLAVGSAIALAGAAGGVPLGLAVAYGLYRQYADALPGGFDANPAGVAAGVAGILLAGVLGAVYPALLAATARPLEALSVRARRPRNRHVVLCGAVGLALAAAQPVAMALPIAGDWVVGFWTSAGLPAAFVGHFLLSVPLLVGVARGAAPALGWLLRVPATLLRQSVLAAPLRQGFTAGALMVSLALLVAVWSSTHSVTAGWLESLRMPDAFVYAFPSFGPGQWEALQRVEAVTRACPATTLPVRALGLRFGPGGIAPPATLFVGTDVASFFGMTQLEWRAGDPETALRRLAGGRAVLVTREWAVAHGVGVGSALTLETLGGPAAFEVVGVIGSPGLDLATHVFGLRRRVSETSVSSVFGTREDARRYFGVDAVNLVLVSLRDTVSDEEAIRQLTAAAPGSVAGTSRDIGRRVRRSFERLAAVGSALAVGSLVLACIGVANLIVAEVSARRFEFGVLRAVGASPGLLGRLVAAHTLIVALVGCAAGTLLGVELVLIEQGFHRRLMGVVYALRLPGDVIAWGSLAVLAAALVAALPTIRRLMRQPPRALLARHE